MIGIVFSIKDPAGMGVADYLVENLKPAKSNICLDSKVCYQGDEYLLAGYEEDVLFFDFLDEKLPSQVSFYLILSRHSSEAKIKSYTVHATGNFTDNPIAGGRPRELGITYPRVMWFLLRALWKLRDEHGRTEYEVSYEATHHGPTSLSKPLVFIEIGSSLDEWIDRVNHEVIGSAVIKLLQIFPELPACIPCIGIGGGHYPRKHTEVALTEDLCYGHIASKHSLDQLDAVLLDMMVHRSIDKAQYVIVERKSTRRDHRELLEEFAKTRGLLLRYI